MQLMTECHAFHDAEIKKIHLKEFFPSDFFPTYFSELSIQPHDLNTFDLQVRHALYCIRSLMCIRGVVANYLASQARDPGIDSHQHQKRFMTYILYGVI